MLNVGFEIVARNQTAHAQMQKGDLELNVTHHVAMAIDRNNIYMQDHPKELQILLMILVMRLGLKDGICTLMDGRTV